ncbi:hypothetical protein BH10PSE12_BH10PSE12_06030 [soil metagenome]
MNNWLISLSMFLSGLACQVAGASILPRTNGFTQPVWTGLCIAVYSLSLWPLAQLVWRGVSLSVVVPLMAAGVPLLTIVVSYFAYGEAGSLTKVGTLIAACTLIGIAGALH